MPHIKKLFVQGFKSFAKPTEIDLSKGINVIAGPNGAGKSNIADALCFVLGRLSMKSMRAGKMINLIYNGGKHDKPAKHAAVELHIDNTDKAFVIDSETPAVIKITRSIRRDGQSVYRINDKTRTRQEVLELLSQQGIGPYGFNIVLQQEIVRFIEMKSEERRKVIEDISGVGIYESRKSKALRELEKTEVKMNEVKTVLHERYTYLKNLESERKQALRFKQLQKNAAIYSLSMLWKKLKLKQDDISRLNKKDEGLHKEKDKIREIIEKISNEISNINDEISGIDKDIQKSTGMKQDELRKKVTELKSKVAGLEVNIENHKNQFNDLKAKEQELNNELEEKKQELKELEESEALDVNDIKTSKLSKLKQDLEKEKAKLRYYEKKQAEEKEIETQTIKNKVLIEEKEKQLEELSQQVISQKDQLNEMLKKINPKLELEKIKKGIQDIEELIKRKEASVKKIEADINSLVSNKNLKNDHLNKIVKIQKCPTCLRELPQPYKENLEKRFSSEIESIEHDLKGRMNSLKNIEMELSNLRNNLTKAKLNEEKAKENLILKTESDNISISIQKLEQKQFILSKEISELMKKIKDRNEIDFSTKLQEVRDKVNLLNEEVVRMSIIKPDGKLELNLAERDASRIEITLKQTINQKNITDNKIKEFTEEYNKIKERLQEKEKEEHIINEKFKTLLEKKESLRSMLLEKEKEVSIQRSQLLSLSNQINGLSVEKARVNAEADAIKYEFNDKAMHSINSITGIKDTKEIEQVDEFNISIKIENTSGGSEDKTIDFTNDNALIEILFKRKSVEDMEKRLRSIEFQLQQMGNVNLKALEAYETTKQEYDKINEKMEQLSKEKQSILELIQAIDRKKKRTFMKAFIQINEEFGKNFSMLSSKGKAILELENKEDPFAGGIDITIKVGKGKYFDVTGLSGGEKTLVALAFIFAIQKFRPYAFYIFDEIDAALDRRNSERLSELIRQHIKDDQCIVITHNDALINQADYLYGVSMQEGISKVISINLDENQ